MHTITTSTLSQPMPYSNGVKYELLWHRDYLEIYYSEEKNFLKLIWYGVPSKEKIIDGCEQIISYVEQFCITKIINDVSKLEGPFTESVEWVIMNFSPRLNACGVLNVAWIYSENSTSRLSADAVVSRSITEIIAIVFDNIESAERWILAV
jgi:hypothetical protein